MALRHLTAAALHRNSHQRHKAQLNNQLKRRQPNQQQLKHRLQHNVRLRKAQAQAQAQLRNRRHHQQHRLAHHRQHLPVLRQQETVKNVSEKVSWPINLIVENSIVAWTTAKADSRATTSVVPKEPLGVKICKRAITQKQTANVLPSHLQLNRQAKKQRPIQTAEIQRLRILHRQNLPRPNHRLLSRQQQQLNQQRRRRRLLRVKQRRQLSFQRQRIRLNQTTESVTKKASSVIQMIVRNSTVASIMERAA